jgi:nucleotidyltransferase/DNA polymerase involved in DNA repair
MDLITEDNNLTKRAVYQNQSISGSSRVHNGDIYNQYFAREYYQSICEAVHVRFQDGTLGY